MNVICINREFASGGREIAKRLSEALGYFYYDKEIIYEIAKHEDLSEEYIESTLDSNLVNYVTGHTFFSPYNKGVIDLLVKETEIIKELAKRGNCIFVGRACSILLKEYNPLKIFVYSDMPSKIKRCRDKREDEDLKDKELIKMMKKIDKQRKQHHLLLGDDNWGKREGYDLMINTANIEIPNIIPSIKDFCLHYFENRKQ